MVAMTSLYRIKGLSELRALFRVCGPRIAKGLEARLAEVLEPGETLPNVYFLVELIERWLGRVHERVRKRDQRLGVELVLLTRARRAREQAAELMRSVFLGARGLLDGCTKESRYRVAFRGRISQHWRRAVEQADAFLMALTRYFQPVALPGRLPYPKADVVRELASSIQAVRKADVAVIGANDKVVHARCRLKAAQDEAANAFSWGLQLIEALAWLADAWEEVERLPKSLRKQATANKSAKKSRKKGKKAKKKANKTARRPAAKKSARKPAAKLPEAVPASEPAQSVAEAAPVSEPAAASGAGTAPVSQQATASVVEAAPVSEPAAENVLSFAPAPDLPEPRPAHPSVDTRTPARRGETGWRRAASAARGGDRRPTGSVRGGARAQRWLAEHAEAEDPKRAVSAGRRGLWPRVTSLFSMFGR